MNAAWVQEWLNPAVAWVMLEARLNFITPQAPALVEWFGRLPRKLQHRVLDQASAGWEAAIGHTKVILGGSPVEAMGVSDELPAMHAKCPSWPGWAPHFRRIQACWGMAPFVREYTSRVFVEHQRDRLGRALPEAGAPAPARPRPRM